MLLPTLLNRVETHRQVNKAWLAQSGNRVVRAWEAVKLQKISLCWHAVGCLGQHFCVVLVATSFICWFGCVSGWLVVVWVLCENCIVDASIFTAAYGLFVCVWW